MARIFEKISFQQFKSDISDDENLYHEYLIPKRKTKYAAGYDFLAIEDFVIHPGEIKKIPTGIKVSMEANDVLLIMVRSKMGFKYNVRLTNQVGVIDQDYYENPDNEGHIWVSLQNEGNKDFEIKKGEGFAQGMFVNYLLTDDEEQDFESRTSSY